MDSDQKFLNQFNRHFLKINSELSKNFVTQVPLIEEIGHHSILGEGKRLRPLLFILSAQMCGYQGEDIYHYSTIFEYIHTASLLHDDVLDNADKRRKRPTANHVWGNSAAVLGGDFLLSMSVGIALGCNNLKFLEILNRTTTKMAEGQVLELVHTHNWHLNKKDYMEIIISKTAELIFAACACGAVISGADQESVDQLGQFGLNLGIAFQLIDDLLDYTSTEDQFGKPVGKDLREGKITLPLIYTLAGLEKKEIERFEDLFKGYKADIEDYKRIINLVRNNGIIGKIHSEARVYVDKAAGFLEPFPDSPIKKSLCDLNSFLIKRSF